MPASTASAGLYGKMPGVVYEDYPSARLIVLWGVNPAVTGIHLAPFIGQARANGAKLVVVDPRRTPFARQADLHLAVRPGTDLPVALSVIRWLFEIGAGGPRFPFAARPQLGKTSRAQPGMDLRASGRGGRSPGESTCRICGALCRDAAGGDSLRLGAGSQLQRGLGNRLGAGFAGGGRQVWRSRRRVHDEPRGRLGRRSIGRRDGGSSPHARDQYESSGPGVGGRLSAPGPPLVRLQLQSALDRPRAEQNSPGPVARGPVHGRARAGDDRHGLVCRRTFARDDLSGTCRAAPCVRGDVRSIHAAGRRAGGRIAIEPLALWRTLLGWDSRSRATPRRPRRLCSRSWRRRAGGRLAESFATTGHSPPPCGPRPVPFVDVFPGMADQRIDLCPDALSTGRLPRGCMSICL